MIKRAAPSAIVAAIAPHPFGEDAARLAAAVAGYEMAQRNRVATGELLRSLLQGRSAGTAPGCVPLADADATLGDIRAGRSDGPLPLLGALYQRESELERACAREMEAVVIHHPSWPWLEKVRGVGAVLAARLLARLRIERASSPSSFWKYCGLATVDGEAYCCPSCGAVVTAPRDRTPPRCHVTPAGEPCRDAMRVKPRAVRVAMRFPYRGQQRTFDVHARCLCHLIGTSVLRCGGRYRAVYDRHKESFEENHPSWSPLHRHLAAMRAMEKMFLAHLWMVWAERAGIPSRVPYEVARRGKAGVLLAPHEMTG